MIRLLARMPFYAVARGRNSGIFETWDECQQQIKGFSGALYKKFKTKCEAEEFVGNKQGPAPKKRKVLTDEEEVKEILKCLEYEEKGETTKKHRKPQSKSGHSSIQSELPTETTLKKYGQHTFSEDVNGYVHVFTDGACENNGTAIAAAGYGVFFGPNHPLNASEPVEGKATNNSGEIQAAIKAIELSQKSKIPKLNIFTDSQFLMRACCNWMPKWKRNGWMLANGNPVKNKIDLERLDRVINSGNMLIKWSYIPAHKGHDGNEAADRLARSGAKKRRRQSN